MQKENSNTCNKLPFYQNQWIIARTLTFKIPVMAVLMMLTSILVSSLSFELNALFASLPLN